MQSHTVVCITDPCSDFFFSFTPKCCFTELCSTSCTDELDELDTIYIYISFGSHFVFVFHFHPSDDDF